MELSEIKNAAIYCGTYKKYNEGSLFGEWINLSDFADKEEFLEYCKKLHKDEEDPELMFQDMEYIPSWLGGESWISPMIWDLMNEDEDRLDVLGHYLQACTIDTDGKTAEELLDEAEEMFVGHFDDEEDLGREMAAQMLNIPPEIDPYFNYEDYGHSFTYDWYEDEGYYFDTNR